MLVAVGIMGLGTLLFQLFPARLLGFFNASEEMLSIGVPALRIISLSYMVAGACIAMGSIFQAFSRSFYSLFVSIGRQLVVLLPAAWLLSRTGDVNMVWWSFPIAEIMSLIASAFFLRSAFRHMERVLSGNLPEPAEP
jgi:Na+-driven multidrug efflux pump